MRLKLTKTFWRVNLLLTAVALLWFPCAPKEISPATAYFGLGAVAGVVYGGYRFILWILAQAKKPASKV